MGTRILKVGDTCIYHDEKGRPLNALVTAVHGDDWDEDFPGAKYMKGINKEAVRTEYYKEQSTTKIIERIRGGL